MNKMAPIQNVAPKTDIRLHHLHDAVQVRMMSCPIEKLEEEVHLKLHVGGRQAHSMVCSSQPPHMPRHHLLCQLIFSSKVPLITWVPKARQLSAC